MWGPRKTRVHFQEPTTQPSKSLKSQRKEKDPSKWALWKDLSPADDHYTGTIQGAIARKHRNRHGVRMKKRADRSYQQRESASTVIEANTKNHASNSFFQDRNLSKKIKIKEAEIDLIMKTFYICRTSAVRRRCPHRPKFTLVSGNQLPLT